MERTQEVSGYSLTVDTILAPSKIASAVPRTIDITTNAEQNKEEEPPIPPIDTLVSSTKRKLGEALSPESIHSDPEVSGKPILSIPLHKKRLLAGKRKKSQRVKPKTMISRSKQSASVGPLLNACSIPTKPPLHNNSTLIDPRDEDDDDYDTSDELPLSGLVTHDQSEQDSTNYPESDNDSEVNKPKTRLKTGGSRGRGTAKKARRRTVGKMTQDPDIVMTLTTIRKTKTKF